MTTAPSAQTILVLGPPLVFKAYEAEFSEKFNFLKPWKTPHVPLYQFISTHSANVKAIFCSPTSPVTGEIIQSLPELRFVLASSIGVDHIDIRECKRRGIVVANAGSTFSEDVADMAVGLLIDVVKRISAGNRLVKARVWRDYPLTHYNKLGGKRVGIVGLGNIGLHIATRLSAMGCIISYTSRTMKPHVAFPFYPTIHQLVPNIEILIISCSLTEQTHHMIDRGVMLVLGKDGVIINVARGAVINEKELIECLVKGEIGGAGLDVFENEPHFPQELFGLDNVVLTPHHGAVTEEACRNLYDLICKNLDAFLSNKPLECEVIDV